MKTVWALYLITRLAGHDQPMDVGEYFSTWIGCKAYIMFNTDVDSNVQRFECRSQNIIPD